MRMQAILDSSFARQFSQPCCMAGTKDSFSHGKRSSFICKIFSLFLPCNMAAVQNLYMGREERRVQGLDYICTCLQFIWRYTFPSRKATKQKNERNQIRPRLLLGSLISYSCINEPASYQFLRFPYLHRKRFSNNMARVWSVSGEEMNLLDPLFKVLFTLFCKYWPSRVFSLLSARCFLLLLEFMARKWNPSL